MPQINASPTEQEQMLLELVNRARMDPAGEFAALIANSGTGAGVQPNITQALSYFGVDLAAFQSQMQGFAAVAPLAWNGALAQAAYGHSLEMIAADAQSHQLPGELSFGDRITAADYTNWRSLRENVYAYSQDMTFAHAGFIIDWGMDDADFNAGTLRSDWQTAGDGMQDAAGHRVALLSGAMTEIGMAAIAEDNSATSVGPWVITQDLGTRSGYQAQLLGVVIDDRDGDAFYDIGEGMGGVTVTATGTAGTFTTQSWGAGGYQMVLPPGAYSVSFTGGGLIGTAVYSVTIGAANIKVDAFADDASGPAYQAGGAGNDRLTAGPRNTLLTGFDGNDTLQGGDGADTLNGGDGDDFIFGGMTDADMRDMIYGGAGHDYIDGGAGNDDLNGGAGNDTILGGLGSDTMVGNDGDDVLAGSGGSDLMFGNAGNDTLNGGFGYDRMNGGAGADSFFHAGVYDHASDWIQDYNAAEGDVLTCGLAGATRDQFQVNYNTTVGAGAADVAEAFVIYRPTGQILWALVDGGDDAQINLQIGGQVFDLLV
ncbi:MAG: CAP domain-containing protein [Paracoccaceae bacterium]